MLLLDLMSLKIPFSKVDSWILTFRYWREYLKKAFLRVKEAALIAVPESGTERLLAVLPSSGEMSVSSLTISTWS